MEYKITNWNDLIAALQAQPKELLNQPIYFYNLEDGCTEHEVKELTLTPHEGEDERITETDFLNLTT